VRLYTTHEAAELTGLTVRALRKRIERGQLRAVQNGRYWRIPHTELARVGLLPADPPTPNQPEGTEGTADTAVLLTALAHERATTRHLTQELARLRPLTAQVEQTASELTQVRAAAAAAEARAAHAARAATRVRARATRGTIAAAVIALASTVGRWRKR
jgi:excisionase family DNA binding protein